MTDHPTDPHGTGPKLRSPLARWIRSLPQWLYITVVLAALVALVLIALVLNPGDRVGPVRPADPPVGGPGLPATRL